MSLDLLFGLAWKSAACAGMTLLVLRAVRDRSAAELSNAAHLGMLATVLTPFAALALHPVTLPAGLPVPPLASAPSPSAAEAATPFTGPVSALGGASESLAALDLGAVAAWTYALPAVLLGLALLCSLFRLQALRGRARMVQDPAWLTALASTQQRSGFRHGTALLVSA